MVCDRGRGLLSRGIVGRAESLIHYDFCPWANRYVYWLRKPIGWLVTAACCAAILGVFVAPQGLAIAAVIVGFIIIGSVWPMIAMRGIEAELTWHRRRCSEGDSVETSLQVSNRWPWPVWGLTVEGRADPANGEHQPSSTVALACLKPLTRTRFRWESVPTRRGLYPDSPTYLKTGFPFGIWTAQTPILVPHSMLVWPKTVELRDIPQWAGRDRSIIGAWVDRAGMEGDIMGARPYRDGDSLRHVHWAQSASRDTLIVCERQSLSQRRVEIDVLCSPTKPITPKDHDRQEAMIRIAATIARAFHAHHCQLVCQVPGHRYVASASKPSFEQLLDGLAVFQARDAQAIAKTGMGGQEPLARLADRSWTSDQRFCQTIRIGITSLDEWRERTAFQKSGRTTYWILVDDSGNGAQPSWRDDPRLWMTIDSRNDIWPQLKRGWERICRESSTLLVG